jgi:adenylosuccinate synthase
VARRALRLGDLANMERFAVKLKEVIDYHNFALTQYYKVDPVDYEATLAEAKEWAAALLPMKGDVTKILHDAREAGADILFEGAQGSLLDIDHGTYPYVTSSNTTAGGAATGTGFGPLYLDYILGITKAYTTRVGSGPFPTELHCEIGAYLGEKGHEFGTTTGRERRCGWFDAVALRQAVLINSISGICLTKLDVLDGLEEINICVGYIHSDGSDAGIPTHSDDFEAITPVYETMSGWTEVTVGAQNIDDLPAAARAYITRIEELIGAPVDVVSTGPDRVETIVLRHAFD